MCGVCSHGKVRRKSASEAFRVTGLLAPVQVPMNLKLKESEVL